MKAPALKGIQDLSVRYVPVRLRIKVVRHEMTGVGEEVARGVSRFKKGDRVVVLFSGREGACEHCQCGNSLFAAITLNLKRWPATSCTMWKSAPF
ncbi:alcohol dehydrogenase catalytic domain-containing protein [Burkholderia sp. R-69980]|nr:alcohol dehydrogenase catalytic domain-containing protein [Burkholderia sp. R-69980]